MSKNSLKLLTDLLQSKDRSAYILSKYIPARAQSGYIGLRAFNLETSRAVDSAQESSVSRLKLEFWKSAVQKIHSVNASAADLKEPVTALLHKAVVDDKLSLPKRYLLTIVQTKQGRLEMQPFRSIEDIERLGEGTWSQLNYAVLDMLHSIWPDTQEYLASQPDLDEMVTNTCAHIGQANGIAASLRTFNFFADKHNFVNLPVDLLRAAGISQQQVLDAQDKNQLSQVDGLQDVVFQTATKANDHILSAANLMTKLKEETGSVPTSLLLSAMSAVPIQLYLQRLEKNDFDLSKPVGGEWKLPWKTWRMYKKRML